MVVRSIVEVLLEERFGDFIRIYTDGLVNLRHSTAVATCGTQRLKQTGRGVSTSKPQKQPLSLEKLLKQPLPAKAIILTDSRCALERPMDVD